MERAGLSQKADSEVVVRKHVSTWGCMVYTSSEGLKRQDVVEAVVWVQYGSEGAG